MQPAPTPEQAPEAGIPDEILQIPAFAGLLRGSPPAVLAPREPRLPEYDLIEKNADSLLASGFGFYRPLDDSGTVIFNERFISPEQLQVADKKGQLSKLVTPVGDLSAAYAAEFGGPEGTAAPMSPTPSPAAPMSPTPTPPQVDTLRKNNLQAGSPTSGPMPGAGRILNSILKPAV